MKNPDLSLLTQLNSETQPKPRPTQQQASKRRNNESDEEDLLMLAEQYRDNQQTTDQPANQTNIQTTPHPIHNQQDKDETK